MHFLCTLFILGITFLTARGYSFDKVVIWGHPLYSHTHSYIHERFYRAFQHMGYSTFWFDGSEANTEFDFSNTLFLTEGQVDQHIPIREDCLYMIHNCQQEKYQNLIKKGRCLIFQVYTDDVLMQPNLVKIDKCIYYDIPNRIVFMPWASDYLPHEIQKMKQQLPIAKENVVHWIGTIGGGIYGNENSIKAFMQACLENQIDFIPNNPWVKGLDREECTRRISTAYFAPTIVGDWQKEYGYIPCRIFITICCGQMGITNSYRTYELFDKKIVYNPDCHQLFYDAKTRRDAWTLADQLSLMDEVENKHTYINRINTLLDFFKLINGD